MQVTPAPDQCLFLEYAAEERLPRIDKYYVLNVNVPHRLMCLKLGLHLVALSWEGKSLPG